MDKKFKITYLLLGIGIGIILASTLYSFFPKIEYVNLSDDIIIEKARELGMVSLKESIELENIDELNEEDTVEVIENNSTGEYTETDVKNETKEGIEIIVERGLGLTEVARMLYNANLIEDVNEFVLFVREKRLDRKIRTGPHIIKPNSSYDEILEILTQRTN